MSALSNLWNRLQWVNDEIDFRRNKLFTIFNFFFAVTITEFLPAKLVRFSIVEVPRNLNPINALKEEISAPHR